MREGAASYEEWIKLWKRRRPALQRGQGPDQAIDRIRRYCARI